MDLLAGYGSDSEKEEEEEEEEERVVSRPRASEFRQSSNDFPITDPFSDDNPDVGSKLKLLKSIPAPRRQETRTTPSGRAVRPPPKFLKPVPPASDDEDDFMGAQHGSIYSNHKKRGRDGQPAPARSLLLAGLPGEYPPNPCPLLELTTTEAYIHTHTTYILCIDMYSIARYNYVLSFSRGGGLCRA